MKKGFWKDKAVLVTGYEGFLGSNLTKRLISLGAKVIGLDIKVRRGQTILRTDDYRRVTVVKGSVTNYKLLEGLISAQKVKIVFHLAAKALVGECHRSPLETFSTNIQGTWNILECCRNSRYVKAIVIASSDKAYGRHDNLPYTEDTPLSGDHPYDVSKSCTDLLAATYYHAYGLPVAVTRCGNIYGPGDFNFSRLIPGAAKSMLSGEVFDIRSDGKYVRDYIYVDDVVAGYMRLAQMMFKKDLAGEAFNFSNEEPLTVIDILKKMYVIAGRRPSFRILNQARYEIKRQYLCADKAKRVLGWKPRFSLSEGLKNTVKAYASYTY